MNEQIKKIFNEGMAKMFRCTVDLIEKDLIPANRQYERAYPLTNVWCVGYRDACRFIAETLQKQAERFEQSEPEPEPKSEAEQIFLREGIGCPVSLLNHPILPHGYGVVCDINEHDIYPFKIRFQDGSTSNFCWDELRLLDASVLEIN